jgi:hypothetical protein
MKNQEELFSEVQDNTDYGTTTSKNEELQNEIHFALCRKPMSALRALGIYGKIGRYTKIFSYMVLLVGIGFIFNSCMGGYIASEPSYTEYARPPRQSETQIWIDGDWNWNNQTHLYVQRAGYWDSPRQGQTYVKGNWQTTQRGKSWNKGHWQRDNHQKNNHQRDNQQNDNRNR